MFQITARASEDRNERTWRNRVRPSLFRFRDSEATKRIQITVRAGRQTINNKWIQF